MPPEDLGPWRGDDLAPTARFLGGVGTDADLPPAVRFLSGTFKLMRRRLAREPSELTRMESNGEIAVFLLRAPLSATVRELLDGKEPMLDQAKSQVAGRLWFLNEAVVQGSFIDVGASDAESIFSFISNDLALGGVPAIVASAIGNALQMRFYQEGVGNADQVEIYNVATQAIGSVDDILEVLDRVYSSCLVTPDAHIDAGRLWADSSRHHPSRRAEGLVQVNLKAGLVGRFPTCTVRHEQTSPTGRLDLEIEECDPLDLAVVTRHAILELKVLRSFTENGSYIAPGETANAVREGLLQAIAYRQQRNPRFSALCCFDMRKDDNGETCFAEVQTRAAAESVTLRRWYIYASAAAYRQAVAGDASETE